MIRTAPDRNPIDSCRPLNGALAFHGEWRLFSIRLTRRVLNTVPGSRRPLRAQRVRDRRETLHFRGMTSTAFEYHAGLDLLHEAFP